MEQFLLWLLIASVGVTLAFNFTFLFFPALVERLENFVAEHRSATTPGGHAQILFPVTAILIGSIALTLLLNLLLILA